MRAVQSCNPCPESFLEPTELLPLINQYSLSVAHDVLVNECTQAKKTLKISEKDEKTYISISEALEELSKVKAAFPNVIKMLQISLTIVITTASCERLFSALKGIKTYLRSTMTEDRLNHIAILSIEKDTSKMLDYSHIIDSFIAKDVNRRIILSWSIIFYFSCISSHIKLSGIEITFYRNNHNHYCKIHWAHPTLDF